MIDFHSKIRIIYLYINISILYIELAACFSIQQKNSRHFSLVLDFLFLHHARLFDEQVAFCFYVEE